MLTRQVGLDRTQDTNTWVSTGHRHRARGPGLDKYLIILSSCPNDAFNSCKLTPLPLPVVMAVILCRVKKERIRMEEERIGGGLS